MMEWFEFRAMNSDILLGAEGESRDIVQGFGETVDLIKAEEARLTRFSEQSELAHLNRSGGSWFRASDELFEILREARELAQETDGLFDPSILDVLESIGYDKSMDEIRAHGANAPGRRILTAPYDFRAIELDGRARAIRLPEGMRLDLGGIAKGWIAERAAGVLSRYSRACAVNAGGDLFAVGHPEEGGWRIALEDPRDEEHVLAVLRTGPGAVATSSIVRRRWRQGNSIQHHLIDPRRQAAAETDWLSVTVMAPHASVAEVYAKTLLIAGPALAPSLKERRQDIAYIAVDSNSQLWGSENAKRFMDA